MLVSLAKMFSNVLVIFYTSETGREPIGSFCETRPKRSVEVYNGRNLHPLPSFTDCDRYNQHIITGRDRHLSNDPSQSMTNILATFPPSQTMTDIPPEPKSTAGLV
jgi:hypothetical protein